MTDNPYQPPKSSLAPEEPLEEGAPIRPWRRFWRDPRGTARALVERGWREGDLWGLVILYGTSLTLHVLLEELSSRRLAVRTGVFNFYWDDWISKFRLSLPVGLLSALTNWFVFAGVIHLVCRNFRGRRSTFSETRMAVAWSYLPVLVELPLLVGSMLLWIRFPLNATAWSVNWLIFLGIALWRATLLFRAVAGVHGISAWDVGPGYVAAIIAFQVIRYASTFVM